MRARIGMAMGTYWGGIVQAIDIIAMIAAIGAVGSLPALLSALTKYARSAVRKLAARKSRTATTCASHALCTGA
jgi:small neutral amino acid transporter SnatA (MarC family)